MTRPQDPSEALVTNVGGEGLVVGGQTIPPGGTALVRRRSIDPALVDAAAVGVGGRRALVDANLSPVGDRLPTGPEGPPRRRGLELGRSAGIPGAGLELGRRR